MLRKLTIDIKVEAQAADDSPLAPLVVEALEEFLDRTNENSHAAGKYEASNGIDITWTSRNEYFDDMGNPVHIDGAGVEEAVKLALMPARGHG